MQTDHVSRRELQDVLSEFSAATTKDWYPWCVRTKGLAWTLRMVRSVGMDLLDEDEPLECYGAIQEFLRAVCKDGLTQRSPAFKCLMTCIDELESDDLSATPLVETQDDEKQQSVVADSDVKRALFKDVTRLHLEKVSLVPEIRSFYEWYACLVFVFNAYQPPATTDPSRANRDAKGAGGAYTHQQGDSQWITPTLISLLATRIKPKDWETATFQSIRAAQLWTEMVWEIEAEQKSKLCHGCGGIFGADQITLTPDVVHKVMLHRCTGCRDALAETMLVRVRRVPRTLNVMPACPGCGQPRDTMIDQVSKTVSAGGKPAGKIQVALLTCHACESKLEKAKDTQSKPCAVEPTVYK